MWKMVYQFSPESQPKEADMMNARDAVSAYMGELKAGRRAWLFFKGLRVSIWRNDLTGYKAGLHCNYTEGGNTRTQLLSVGVGMFPYAAVVDAVEGYELRGWLDLDDRENKEREIVLESAIVAAKIERERHDTDKTAADKKASIEALIERARDVRAALERNGN